MGIRSACATPVAFGLGAMVDDWGGRRDANAEIPWRTIVGPSSLSSLSESESASVAVEWDAEVEGPLSERDENMSRLREA